MHHCLWTLQALVSTSFLSWLQLGRSIGAPGVSPSRTPAHLRISGARSVSFFARWFCASCPTLRHLLLGRIPWFGPCLLLAIPTLCPTQAQDWWHSRVVLLDRSHRTAATSLRSESYSRHLSELRPAFPSPPSSSWFKVKTEPSSLLLLFFHFFFYVPSWLHRLLSSLCWAEMEILFHLLPRAMRLIRPAGYCHNLTNGRKFAERESWRNKWRRGREGKWRGLDPVRSGAKTSRLVFKRRLDHVVILRGLISRAAWPWPGFC